MKTIMRTTLEAFNFVSSPLVSPDGRFLAYRQAKTDSDKNKYLSHIRIYDTTLDKDYRLTSEDIGSGMRFLDETTLTFVANRDDHDLGLNFNQETKIYQISLLGGEAELYLVLPYEVEEYHFISPDELLLQVLETPVSRALDGLKDEDKKKREKELKEEQDYEVLEEAPFWFNGKGFTNGQRSRIYRYKVSTSELSALSPKDLSSSILDFDPKQGRFLFVSENKTDLLDIYNQLFVYDLLTDEVKELSLEKKQAFHEACFAGKDIIFMATDMERYGLNEDAYAYIFKQDQEIPELLSEDVFVGSTMGTDVLLGSGVEFVGVEDGVYYCSTDGTSSYLMFVDKKGQPKRVIDKEGAVNGIALHQTQTGTAEVYICAMRGLAAQELYKIDEEGERQLTFANKWLEEYALSPIESFSFQYENDNLQGFVIKPTQYQEGQKHPGILTIHGGPKTVYGAILHHEMQMLAAQGYFVFYTNPRGSDGFGRDWADIRGNYGKTDYQHLMAFTDAVLERYPAIDIENLGVMGGSYGGFMTNWIIGHTNRFKAACTQRSISNWFTMYGISDIGYYFTYDQVAADPWSNREKLWEQSPLKYAETMKTPTLIIHSDEDYRCPVAEGQQLFTALKVHGVPCRMVIFKGENHELSRSGKPTHRQRRLKEIENWFDKYLK